MGFFRFRKSVKIAPGLKVNIGRHGISSVSVGGRGAHATIGHRRLTKSIGIPGTGISYVSSEPLGGKSKAAAGSCCLVPAFTAVLVLASVPLVVLFGRHTGFSKRREQSTQTSD